MVALVPRGQERNDQCMYGESFVLKITLTL